MPSAEVRNGVSGPTMARSRGWVASAPLCASLALIVVVGLVARPGAARAQPVKNRISVLVDSSGSMLLTPEIVTTTKACTTTGTWNPCNGNGVNPSLAQETCNPCVVDTINFAAGCATNWSAGCANDYAVCIANVTGQGVCSPSMTISDGIATRGDGSADLPGCDVNGDGLANDSRMYQAKQALGAVVSTFGEVEFSLWRYAQVTGGQACASDAACPDTPGGLSVLTCEDHDNNAGTGQVCALDADILDGATAAGVEGQCERFTYTGSANTFSCNNCDFLNTYDRATCSFYDMDRVRTGGMSPLNGAAVTCLPQANPQHRFMRYHGGFVGANNACDPTGAQRLVDFPATGFDDNYSQIMSWIDGNQSPFTTTDELRPNGGTPIAASLRDMRASVLAAATNDTKTPCRKHQVVILTDGGESCESVAAAVTAAGTFQNLSFVNAAGVNVPDYDVPVYVIGFAICPPGQPNCQTRQDLNSIAVAGGTGSAILVNNQLQLQLALAQIVAASVVTERCNGLDDNCNGLVDEDFPGKGAACSAGVGACQRNGNVVCTADQLGLTCNAAPGVGSAEICNGLDDNCDGLVDNGINCQGCVRVCNDTDHCDVCNGLDEDCDGQFDEDFAPGPCGVDTGACQSGTTACVMGQISCQGAIGPVAETCNNLDDDCDAIVDGQSRPCYPAASGCSLVTGTCAGVCRIGNQSCAAGVFGACAGAVTPGIEIACNNLDDDCDGLTDEGAGTEQCNGVDDNCNGLVDEGVAITDPDIGAACGTPPFVGRCHAGAIACVAGAQVCVGEVDPVAETCNTLDDNCNGAVDDNVPGFGGACGSAVGRCLPGTLQCVNGQPDCVGDAGPFAEVCNALDDNCNGAVDETDPMLGDTCATLPGGGVVPSEAGECQFGVLACTAGGLVCIGAVGPTAERCNARDDDCDNLTDETFPGLGNACTNGALGVCQQVGVLVCAPGGLGTVCTAPPGVPGTESCNGLDDDCDGHVDEDPLPLVGDVCAPAIGVCMPGLWECVGGMLQCGSPSSGSPEICNGNDDDCDALVDEHAGGLPLPGEGQACVEPGFEAFMDTGECAFGQTLCVAGGLDCVGYLGPSPEICDGLDNDCDGVGDDQATCPDPGNVCHMGACVVPCGAGEFPCPGGFVCQHLDNVPTPGDFCVADPCANVTCGANEACDPQTGTCRDLCQGVACRAGEECRAGFCLDCFDLPARCLPGQLCVADDQDVGQCVDNPCDPNPCDADQVCSGGVCSDACGGGCPTGQACIEGACVADACEGVRCPTGEVCNPATGTCGADHCDAVQCHPGEVCVPVSGECIADPCADTVCPTGTTCAIDGGGRPVCDVPRPPGTDRVTVAGGGCCSSGGSPDWLALALLLPLALRGRRRRGGGRLAATVAVGLVLGGCNLNPFDLGRGGPGDGDGGRDALGDGTIGDGGGDGDGGVDAGPIDACLPSPEVCNQLDDDCDGTADDGFNLQADPNNCGMCGMRCAYPNAFGSCTAGACGQGACQPGWIDTDPAMPGCDYFCIPTGGGVEVCDGRDNDCDHQTDEDFDLTDDVDNCGACGRMCNLLHATEACNAGACEVAACDLGFVDVNPAVPGCEYQCTPTGGGVETCDGVDNDCDGMVDDGNPGGGASCGTDTGVCVAGTTQCVAGVLFCMGQVGGGAEVCNNLDDDCDAVVDDGFDKQNDPQHCGGCAPCVVPHAVAGCAVGACTVAGCQFGFIDRNGQPADGCEYQCIVTGAETCDGVDNDCDGLVDEGFDLTSDPGNCGACGMSCSYANAAGVCSNSACQLGACAPNFHDINHLPGDGCEYGCVPTNGGVERCDGVDNDCDGLIDDGNPGGGGGCGTDTGACTAGVLQCVGGALDCVGDLGPVAEACNNVDDDCNGAIDNGFDRQNDPRYCGNCTPCALDHAVAGCAMGGCTVAGCLAGWVNLDGQAGNGCEYACTFSGNEVCDGRDNDCDGLVDALDPGLVRPANFCRTLGECVGTTPSCTGAGGWDCQYTDPDVELDGTGDIVLEETRCDGKDNDCDGGRDETFPLKNTACGEDGTFGTGRKLGACRGTGTLQCNAGGNALVCNVTAPGAAPAAEGCNQRDDDCDGHTDEPYDAGGFAGVRDVTVGPVMIGGQPVVMYRYEASRPDATGLNPGFVETRACSVAGRLPWASGNLLEVQQACAAAGMRLCRVTRDAGGAITSDEWGRFCEGPTNFVFPYGGGYQPNFCNGSDYDPVAGGVNEDLAIGTGNLATCEAPELGRDLSGNLKEWTDDVRVVGGQNVYTLRGGSYDNHAGGLTCDFDLTVVDAGYTFANAGFRCCARSCAAGQIDCGGVCTDAATSNNNCGGCGRVCGGGQACSNGYCCPVGSRACGDLCVPNAMACP